MMYRDLLIRGRSGILLGLLLLCFGCGGSGGGSSSGTPPSIEPIANDAVRVVPDAADPVLAGDGTLTLQGVHQYDPGAVLVSGEGSGLLRKVVSSEVVGGSTVLVTEQGTLTDVFRQGTISLDQELGPDAFASVTPLVEGVTLEPLRTRAGDFTHKLTLPQMSVGPITISGTANIRMGLKNVFEIKDLQLTRAEFLPRAVADGQFKVQGKVNQDFEFEVKYASLVGNPITLQVPGIPKEIADYVPVVITPKFDLYLRGKGNAKAGFSVTVLANADVEAGLRFESTNGWQPASDIDMVGSMDVGQNVWAEMEGWATPVSVDAGLEVYGVLTSSVYAELPRLLFGLKRVSDPEDGQMFSLDALFRGKASVNVTILGKELVNETLDPIATYETDIARVFFPDDGGLGVVIK